MARKLSDKALDELLKSERADGLVILNPEDAESIKATVKGLRGEPAPKKAAKKTKSRK
ncbi:MAG TPA: hypothetical protein VLB68_28845 [Pyrinomonadaceae bacterium]|nr:hypothetical protein [Pyrinomonadaceae bacterium]